MMAPLNTSRITGPLRTGVALMLVCAFIFASAGELIAGHCGDECDDHCDEACSDCGDCLQCLPLQHMIPALQPVDGPADRGAPRAVESLLLPDDSGDPGGIDRPPQLI
jgi:hypothetical protein